MNLNDLNESMTKLEKSIDTLISNADKAARIIEKLDAALKEIEEYAEDQYDGPEDRHWGWVLARCRDARGR